MLKWKNVWCSMSPNDGAWQCVESHERTLTEHALFRKVLRKLKQTPGHVTNMIVAQVGLFPAQW